MTNSQHAYSTDNPDVVAAFHQAVADRGTWLDRLKADIKALNAGPRFFGTQGAMGLPANLSGLEQTGDHIPDGWRIIRGHLEPRRGKPGEAARQWLADHQPVDVRHVMTRHGMPRSVWVEARAGSFSYRVVSPEFFEHDGALWVCYEIEPGTSGSGFDEQKCTWTPRKLSEFHAAREAHDEAEKAAEAVAAA